MLFCTALACVAGGLVTFFAAFTGYFARGTAGSRLSAVACACGAVTALSFIGVAATPWNHFLAAHNAFVQWAFRSYLLAMFAEIAAVLVTPGVPRRFAAIFAAFTLVLGAYVVLLTVGPRPDTAAGARVQATGQKIVVYASVLTILAASLVARRR